MLERGWLPAFALALVGCSFDGGGVADDAVDAAVDGDASGDLDEDGVADAVDNCPETANRNQEDEDSDAVGNVCDNCPHVANADQANAGETAAGAAVDGAGDACDPAPDATGNDILYFEGFDDPDVQDDWRAQGGGSWTVSGGAMRQSSTTGFHTLYSVVESFGSAVLHTRITVDDLPTSSGPSDTNRGVATVVAFASGGGNGTGYLCLLYTNPQVSPSGTISLATLFGAQPTQSEAYAVLGTDLQEGASYLVEQHLDATTGAILCGAESTALPSPFAVGGTDSTYVGGFVGLRTQNTAAHYDYVVVFGVDG